MMLCWNGIRVCLRKRDAQRLFEGLYPSSLTWALACLHILEWFKDSSPGLSENHWVEICTYLPLLHRAGPPGLAPFCASVPPYAKAVRSSSDILFGLCSQYKEVMVLSITVSIFPNLRGQLHAFPVSGDHLNSAAVGATAPHFLSTSDGNPCLNKMHACGVVPAAPFTG